MRWQYRALHLSASRGKKYLFVLAFVSNELLLLTLMPAHLAYSAIFPPRQVAFST